MLIGDLKQMTEINYFIVSQGDIKLPPFCLMSWKSLRCNFLLKKKSPYCQFQTFLLFSASSVAMVFLLQAAALWLKMYPEAFLPSCLIVEKRKRATSPSRLLPLKVFFLSLLPPQGVKLWVSVKHQTTLTLMVFFFFCQLCW